MKFTKEDFKGIDDLVEKFLEKIKLSPEANNYYRSFCSSTSRETYPKYSAEYIIDVKAKKDQPMVWVNFGCRSMPLAHWWHALEDIIKYEDKISELDTLNKRFYRKCIKGLVEKFPKEASREVLYLTHPIKVMLPYVKQNNLWLYGDEKGWVTIPTECMKSVELFWMYCEDNPFGCAGIRYSEGLPKVKKPVLYYIGKGKQPKIKITAKEIYDDDNKLS